ncbi:hypothetical protein PAXRUDRAFT_134242 [Paxillus rubicundulus Ve08.2h10]|uniref:Uncharacterized protein n=1 Tax=Paxillus rubicundulus Ve08.2h10 TaxID=930991 RepID=A0A0D0DJ99_9AGAM|nr:hypothetical protein PAXRUDRAFT_134242 [Paxillus rubicundulus Ve08.2h10]
MVLFSPTHSFSRPTHAFLAVPMCFQLHLLIFSATTHFQPNLLISGCFQVFFFYLILSATHMFSALPVHFQLHPLISSPSSSYSVPPTHFQLYLYIFSHTHSFSPVPTCIQPHSLTWLL